MKDNPQTTEQQELSVSFTIFKSAGILSKKFTLNGTGIVKTPAAQMSSGTAHRTQVDFREFGQALSNADEKTAFGYGLYPDAFGNQVKIRVQGREREADGIISRTQRYFEYRQQPGIVMNDHDPHPRGPSVTPGELQVILEKIFPGFGKAASLVRGSLSSGVHRPDEQPQPGKGFHLYTPVPEASDIPRFGAVLFKRLWLDGYGYIAISAAGTFLTRSIIDSTVYSPERLDFVGRPVVGDGLIWTPPEPVYKDGGYLNTRLLPDLSSDEEWKFNQLVADAKRRAEPERAATRAAWVEKQVKRMVERGVPEEQARQTLQRIATDGTQFDLYKDFVLDFANHGSVSVGDVLKNAEQYNCKALADPFEGTDYGTTTAKFYANEEAGNPCINSNAHGGMKYFLYAAAEQKEKPEWAEPQPLPIALPEVEPFDYALLPETLEPWARDICERVGCPPDYVAVSIMTALGAVIGRKVGIRPQEKTDWTVTANQWALCVGRPGVLKSPAMEAALAPLKRLVAKASDAHSALMPGFLEKTCLQKLKAEAREKSAKKKLAKDPECDVSDLLREPCIEPPSLKRYIANNSTAEALAELHRQNTNGLLVFRDELVSLLKVLDREESSEARGFYLTGWNGDSPYTFDRIMRGLNLHIPAVCLSLLGSTQPGKISQYVSVALNGGSGDDGLLQRFGLTVWPDTSGTWREVDRWPNTDAKNAAFKTFEYLDTLDVFAIGAQEDKDSEGRPEGIPYLRFDKDALCLFREWRTDLERRLREDVLHPALESHLTKYRKLVPGLSLILHLACGNKGPVTRDATLQALAWADYLESHANRLYASVVSLEVSTAAAILNKIKSGALASPFASWNVWRACWAGLSDKEQVKGGLQFLVDLGWLRVAARPTTGRTAKEYEINPKGFSQ